MKAADKAQKAEKTDRAEKADKSERVEKTEKPNAEALPPAAVVTAPIPPVEVAAAPPAAEPEASESDARGPPIAVEQTRFAVDLGGANSISGLRALWQGVIKSNPELAALRPIMMIQESKAGPGMQLRLGAGPLVDAAAAAKICARLTENARTCETTVFDGQRLSMQGRDAAHEAETSAPASAKPDKHRRNSSQKLSKREEPATPPAAALPKPEPAPSTLSSFFNRNKN
jgi:hypothetical protein